MDREALVARQQRDRGLTERVVADGPTPVVDAHHETEGVELLDDLAPLVPRRVTGQRHAGRARSGRPATRARDEGDEPVVGLGARRRAREQQRVAARVLDEVPELGVRRGRGRRAARELAGGVARRAARSRSGSRARRSSRAPAPRPGRRCGCSPRSEPRARARGGSRGCPGRPSAGRRGAARGIRARRSPRPSPRRGCHRARTRTPAARRGRASSAAAGPRRRARPGRRARSRTACRTAVFPIPASPTRTQDARRVTRARIAPTSLSRPTSTGWDASPAAYVRESESFRWTSTNLHGDGRNWGCLAGGEPPSCVIGAEEERHQRRQGVL